MKHSIKTQVSCRFIIILTCTIGACMIFNVLFLGSYYLLSRQIAMQNAYERLNDAATTQSLTSSEFINEIRSICQKYGISVIVMNDNNQVVASIQGDDSLKDHLLDYFINGISEQSRVIKEEQNYMLVGSQDRLSDRGFLEMWGVLDNGNVFMIQSTLENVSNSAYLANKFLFRVGLIAIIFGAFSIIIMTKQFTRPIYELVVISERMTNLDFEAKYSSRGNNEIDLLGERMNSLSDKLENTISELKTANNELIKDIEVKEKNEELRKEFLANVSHELKTPIALIQGYAEGLKEGITDDPDSMAFYCDVIVDEANKMNNLVKSLMSLNELEAGSGNVTVERFDICELIGNCIQSMDIVINKNSINLNFERTEPIYIWSDELKVEEVFRNYFTNAINHVKGEKEITVSVVTEGDIARVSVFNTGDPIPEANLPYIWDKFYKVDKARSREYGGSGVGLSIVKAAMERLHQNYGVINKDNGVEFWFEVPTK